MKKMFLHIGAGKTGTSALQSHFALNKQNLEKYNYYYPEAPNESRAKELKITSGNGIDLAKLLMAKDCHIENIQEILSNYIKGAKGKDIIISSEVLSLFQPECALTLKNIANSLEYEIIIIFYVRAIADHFISSYHQQLKRHAYSKNFITFLKNKRNDFLEIINKSIYIFGNENVLVKNYDAVKENIFLDFLKKVLSIDDVKYFIVKNKKINRSLTGFEVALMQHMNKMFDNNRHSTFISDSLIYGDPNVKYEMSISEEDFKIIHTKYNDDILKINEYLIKEEKPYEIVFDIKIRQKNDIKFNNFQKSVVSILAELTKRIQ